MDGTDSSSMPIGAGRLTIRPRALDWIDVEGEIVVLDVERSVYLVPNTSGAILWRKLTSGSTQEALEAALVEAFEIAHERAKHDVAVFIDRLTELGLLADHNG